MPSGNLTPAVNPSDTMSRLSRRSFLAGSTAALAAPALRASAQSADVDVAVVGAGAAGIAAARRALAAKARVAVFEAGSRIGGRCVTDTALFGVPFDLGAHWIRYPDEIPFPRKAAMPPSTSIRRRAGNRSASARAMRAMPSLKAFLTALLRAHRAIDEAARGKADMAAARALPADLGAWQSTIGFALGPFFCGQDLDNVSVQDLGHAGDRERAAFCRQGYGTLLARLANGLPVRLSTPGDARRLVSRPRRARDREGPAHRAHGNRDRLDQCHRRRQDRVRAGSAARHAGGRGKSRARQLRSHRRC